MLDPRFRVEVISQTPNPQQTVYAAMHQDYAEGFVYDERDRWPTDRMAGEIVVKHLLAGDRGHWGPLEHPSITLSCGYFPHSVMQQARTHRVGISFDCQSMRYTGDRVCAAARGELPIEDVFYLRPAGHYRDRQGKKYYYSDAIRANDLDHCHDAACRYEDWMRLGFSEEHARGILPFDYRQHFVVSFNLRSVLHFLDLRFKKDAQLEIQELCRLIWPHIQSWVPEIADWYEQNRLGKARLAP